jgi:hypothetical protein
VLLLYTAVLAPVQVCLWDYDDPCNAFPTLYFDVAVDAFFLVRRPAPRLSSLSAMSHGDGTFPLLI